MKQGPVKWLIAPFVLVMSAILYQGTASTSSAFGPYQSNFNSPIPTPTVNPTAVPETSKLTQLALNHIATRAHIPVEQLILDNEHQRDYSLLGRSFWAVTALDAINGDWYTVLTDLGNSAIIDDVDSIEQAERDAQRRKYGKLDPSLFERLQSIPPNDKVPVAIWIASPPKQSPEEMYAVLAAKYPRANEAFQRSGKPFDVGDQKLGNALEAEYAKMVEEETSALTQALANNLQEQGDAVESLRGMPVITALMSKAGILRTASRIDVGAIYLIEGESKPELDTAVPTDRAPTVWKRGFKGNGVNIGILESGKVDFTGPAGHNYLQQGEIRTCSVVEDRHKTMVASAAASYHDVYTGIAPEATVVDACNNGSLIDIVDGLNWATERSDTINMSEYVEENGQMNFIDKAFDYWALVGNDTIVKSAGNNGITVTSPGMAWNIITVGAIDAKSDPDWANDIMWPDSSWKNFTGGDRKKPEVVAPGASIRAIGLDSGSPTTCGGPTNIPAKATGVFVLNVSDGYLGSAVVSSSSRPIATLIYESGSPYKLVSNAPLQGTAIAYAPEIYGNYPMNGWTWNSGLHVQNVGGGTATVTVTYYSATGTLVTTTQASLGVNRLKVFNTASGNMPTNFAGSAVITSDQPIVATVNNSNSAPGVDNKASYTASNR